MFLKQGSKRIPQLDGLRGLAIVLVIISHLRLEPLFEAVPKFFHPLLLLITSNGKAGVSILFMLSGFLMMTLYPVVQSKLHFWQKRYERIFPSFTIMCLVLGLTRFYSDKLPILSIFLLVTLTFSLLGLTWKKIQNKLSNSTMRTFFLAFLGLQALTAIAYFFLQSAVEPSIFYNVWPKSAQALVQLLVNLTMTLPFGIYVGQLDGVYWSLVTEVFFYLLYPVLFLPVFHQITKHSKKLSPLFIGLLILTLLTFLVSLSLLFQKFLGFYILQVQMVSYFIAGMTLGYLKDHPSVISFQNHLAKWPKSILVIFIILATLGLPVLREVIYFGNVAESLFWPVPLSLVFLLALSKKETIWTKFLIKPPLIKLGIYSYALYLTHTIAIEMMVKNGEPETLPQMIIAILFSIAILALLSFLLHHLVEKTYFNRKKSPNQNQKAVELEKPIKKTKPNPNLNLIILSLSLFLISALWYSFKIPTSFASLVTNHKIPNLPENSIISDTPLIVPFGATHDNLGMLYLHLKRYSQEEIGEQNKTIEKDPNYSLIVSVKDDQNKEIVSNRYQLEYLSSTPFHVVGLPLQTDSENKNYRAEIKLENENASQMLALVNDGAPLKSVYLLSKPELLSNHTLLFKVLSYKATQPFLEKEAQLILILALPFLLVLGKLALLGSKAKAN